MSTSITLNIGNVVPHAGNADSAAILGLWRDIGASFRDRAFSAQAAPSSPLKRYGISLDAAPLLQTLEQALQDAGSFSKQRQAHIDNPATVIAGSLKLDIAGPDGDPEQLESYQVATVFLQQLLLAANLVVPGSFQILDADFEGPGSHLVEAPIADTVIFHGARRSLEQDWQRQYSLGFEQVWNWLEARELSHTHIAIKGLNKVLLTMLKVAEQRHEYGARTVLLVLFQLEQLLDCHTKNDLSLLRRRLKLALDEIPEAADYLKELFKVRGELLCGTQPVNRPPLLSHTTHDALEEQLGQYNKAVTCSTGLVLVLLQELILAGGSGYSFRESISIC